MDRIDQRAAVRELAQQHGDSWAALSRALGRNIAYMQNYFYRGSPKRLDEEDRLTLAKRWNVDERLLGAREPWSPDHVAKRRETVAIRCIDLRQLHALADEPAG